MAQKPDDLSVLKELRKQQKEIEKKIAQAKKKVDKPPMPKQIPYISYPPPISQTGEILWHKTYNLFNVRVDIEEILSYLPDTNYQNYFISGEPDGHNAYEGYESLELQLYQKVSQEDVKKYEEECRRIDKENKKNIANFNKQLQGWKKLYG